MKFLGKMYLTMTKQSSSLSLDSIFLYVKTWWSFFNETLELVFAELAIFHSIYIRMKLRKIVRKITR